MPELFKLVADLKRDWRRWQASERMFAVILLTILIALAPSLGLGGL